MRAWAPAATVIFAAVLCWATVLRGGLSGVVAWYLLLLAVPLMGLVFLTTVLISALRRRPIDRGTLATFVASLLALWPASWWFGLLPPTYPAALHSTRPSATVRLPADGPLKVVWGGDRVDVNYHAASPDQRWAYDLVVEPYLTGSPRLEEYGCYRLPVVAPAAGRVVAARDGELDAIPGRMTVNLTAPFGNYVAIRLAAGTHLVVAHLAAGSVAVAVGDELAEGELIGRCGNSGNTSEPHIHIHHQRQNPADFPVGVAEGLPLFFRDHDGPPMPEGGLREKDGRLAAIGDVVQHLGG